MPNVGSIKCATPECTHKFQPKNCGPASQFCKACRAIRDKRLNAARVQACRQKQVKDTMGIEVTDITTIED